GIYLKEDKFVHTSTSKGVMISSLDEDYFRKTWVCGGRVKHYK
ncbi:MAG TPA: NlpC/P60 family protein, partial [Paludibacter sp.]